MKKELITELWQRFEAASGTLQGVECWSARDLQGIFGYANWQNFHAVVTRAQEACQQAGEPVVHHFTGISKMIDLGKGAQRAIDDLALTRYACYLIAQNGDPNKPGNAPPGHRTEAGAEDHQEIEAHEMTSTMPVAPPKWWPCPTQPVDLQ